MMHRHRMRRRNFAHGSVGRRLILLFMLVALIPLALLAIYSVSRVSSAVLKIRQTELVQISKSYGMGVAGRIRHVQEWAIASRDAASDPQEAVGAIASRLREEVSAVALIRDGKRVMSVGELTSTDLPARTPHALDMPNAPTLVLSRMGNASSFQFVVPTRPGTAREHIVISLNDSYLWGSRDDFPPMTDIAVLSDGTTLFQSHPLSPRAQVLLNERIQNRDHSGAVEARQADGDMRYLGYWTLSLAGLGGQSLTIVAGQPASYVTGTVQSFNHAFIPIALLSALAAALLAFTQIRRILEPLDSLKSAAMRMAKNDFSRPVSVHGKDELAELGSAFNAMSEQIGQQVATLHRYAEIDRIVLTTLDVDAVIERALSGILSLTEVSSVAIILRGDDKRPLRRYFCSHDNDSLVAQDVVDETALPCWVHGRRWIERERLQSPALWSWAGSERMLCCRDIEHPSHRVGLLILAHPTERQFSDAVEKQIAGLLDRVAIALSATEREQRLVQQARYDSLTGLPNRHYFLETLDAAMGASAGGVQRGVLLFLDLDHFKRANDVLGHLAGDALLKMAAQRMQQVIHAPHVLARLGGDEFTILYRGCAAGPEATEDAGGIDAADIDKLTNALIDSLNQPFYLEGRSVFVSLSIGSARFPEDGTSALDLLRRADTAMYHAKKAGRQRHVAFQPPMEKDFQESLALDQSIRDALIGEQLQLFLQVQVDARSGAPVGAEALIRWFGADDSVRGPQEWLAHAENSNLINEVGAWVLTRACQQLRRADQQGCRIARIAVNVSAKQLSNEHFYEDVTRALAAAGISPHRLELEITESQLMASPELSVAMLRRLTSLGIALAVDDFGTGYSSFSQLRLLPLSVLKIDRSFICDIDASEDARAVVLAIIQMAHALRLTVVAEGVENAAQQAVLIELGCDAIQGYFTGRPVPEEQFLERHGNGLDPKTAGPPAVRLIAP